MTTEQGEGRSEELIMSQSSIPPHLTMEGIAARTAAVKLLWDKRMMLPENSEEIVEDVIDAVAPFLKFSPLGDNHHNARVCPYCTPGSE